MKISTVDFRKELKKQLEADKRFIPWIVIFTSCVFPIVEAILVNVWTSDKLASVAGLCLVLIGSIHLILAAMVITVEFRSKNPLVVLANAAELADMTCATRAELDRRIQLYKMFRDSIEMVNTQVCSLYSSPDTFGGTLRPIIRRFIDSLCTTLGVCSNKYTLEVYLLSNEYSFGKPHPGLSGYSLGFFESPTISADEILSVDGVHPLHLVAAKPRNVQGFVGENSGLFAGENGKCYFNQYAIHLIPTQCGTGHLGFVVFTTPQVNPIADDALETLGLLASIISSFSARWQDCVTLRMRADEIDRLKKNDMSGI